jgi:3-hydroxybutyryl-CoA dehydrogenase
VAVTEVHIPSIGHEDVPYWVALLRCDDGRLAMRKLDVRVALGDRLAVGGGPAEDQLTVGVVGSGVMGRGLVELMLTKGHPVVFSGRSLERLESARKRVLDRLARVMDEAQVADADSRLGLSEGPAGLAGCDVVVEAVVEDLAPKAAALQDAESAMREDAVLATNTSSLPLGDLSLGLAAPERFGGLHFFNPPNRMRLIEIARCPKTTDETAAFLDSFASSLGKIPVRVAAKPGFVVNRVLMPLLNEAVRVLEDGVAPADDIDQAVRLGLNHPMGPLALADLIGLDVVVSIMDDLHERIGDEAYAPRPYLRELVAAGKLGRKTGEGFYSYEAPPNVV